jgi:hypothetical protein
MSRLRVLNATGETVTGDSPAYVFYASRALSFLAMTGPPVRVSAYYSAPVDRFLTTEPYPVLGALASAHSHDLDVEQRQAWEEELLILKEALTALTGTLFLEFDVPRLGSRIDAVLISGSAVFPIEFKCGESHYRPADYNQAWDYALDLKNFHAGSHEAPIFPVLVATQAQAADDAWQPAYADGVRPPYRCNARHVRRALLRLLFDHGAAQAHFGASVFWIRRRAAWPDERVAVEFWQVKRGGGRRGIVEIIREAV